MLRRLALLSAGGAAAVVVAGCGAGSGVPAASPTPVVGAGAPASVGAPTRSPATSPTARPRTENAHDLLSQARRSLEHRAAYRIKGTTTYAGKPLDVDLTVTKAAARGSLTYGKDQVKVLRVGSTAYLKGAAAGLANLSGVSRAKADTVGRDSWLSVPLTTSDSAALALTDPGLTLVGDSPVLEGSGFFRGQSVRVLQTGGFDGLAVVLPRDGATLLGVFVDADAKLGLPVSDWPDIGLKVKPPAKTRVVT